MPAPSYTTPEKVKEAGRLDIVGTEYDAALLDLCLASSRWIDQAYGGGVEGAFQATGPEATRFYEWANVSTQAKLLLDAPLLSLASFTGFDGEDIPLEDVLLYPLNRRPARLLGLRLGTFWAAPTGLAEVTGVWGQTATLPPPVEEAATMLAAWSFKRYQSALNDSTAVPELGQLVYSDAIPKQVLALLRPFSLWSPL